jgi:thiazole synthase
MNGAASSRPTESTLCILRQEVEIEKRRDRDQLIVYGHSFASRLLLGTASYDSPSLLADAIGAADPAMLTTSLRHEVSGSRDSGQPFWNLLQESARRILPNTAGCFSAREAVKTACMARELLETNLIK